MTPNRPLKKAMLANSTATGFTAKTALRSTAPSGNTVMPVAAPGGGGQTPKRMRIYPYGLGASNDVFSMRVFGWYRYNRESGTVGKTTLWMPAQIGEFSCTLGTFAGLADSPVLNTELFCDTISIVATVGEATYTANTTRTGTAMLYSPANDMPAWVEIPIGAPEFLEFDWDQTTNTPEMNAFIEFIDNVQFG